MLVKQCYMTKGNESKVAWIPLHFAVPGKELDLKDGGVWSGPWDVISVYTVVQEGYAVRDHQRVDMPSLRRS